MSNRDRDRQDRAAGGDPEHARAAIDARFAEFDGRFTGVDGRFSRVDGRLAELNGKVDSMLDRQIVANFVECPLNLAPASFGVLVAMSGQGYDHDETQEALA
ncbi:MAG: hypothetical protein GY720_02265 [bacterium]|nr:hypothetical protein [bacterium]